MEDQKRTGSGEGESNGAEVRGKGGMRRAGQRKGGGSETDREEVHNLSVTV